MRFIAATSLCVFLLGAMTDQLVGTRSGRKPMTGRDSMSQRIATRVEDCLVSGLIFSTGGGVFPPIIQDNGTVMGTNGVGCDGCTVRWDVAVQWFEDGNGTTEVGGIRVSGPVLFGEETTITSPTLDITCDSETVLRVTGHSGQWAQFKVKCRACQ